MIASATISLHLFFLLQLLLISTVCSDEIENKNNHALILSSSTYFHNYRHTSNAFLIYNILKKNKIPDSNIIFMISDDHACDARNPFKNSIFSHGIKSTNLYGKSVEIDYRGVEVTPDLVKRVLLGRTLEGTPLSKKMMLNKESNVLVYMTGHGGDGFFKFLDKEEITSWDFANLFSEMKTLGRYNKLLFMTDTCQAFTLSDHVESSGVISVGSSLKDQNSYAYGVDRDIGVSAVDRFTRWFYGYLKDTRRKDKHGYYGKSTKLYDVIKSVKFQTLRAHVGIKASDGVDLNEVTIDDFFSKGGQTGATIMTERVNLKPSECQNGNMPRRNFPLWPHNDDQNKNRYDQQKYQQQSKQSVGIEPSHPLFLVSCTFFVAAVFTSSLLW